MISKPVFFLFIQPRWKLVVSVACSAPLEVTETYRGSYCAGKIYFCSHSEVYNHAAI